MDISSLRDRSGTGVFSVGELNNYIKNLLDSDRLLKSVTVRGEISNFTRHSTGHLYFSLKDADGQIRSVMFRSSAARLRFYPESGMKVTAHGQVSVYPRDGSYQLYVYSLEPEGVGALYLAYEQLKARLASEGLFDRAAKRRIPSYPERIGVITSPTGAAVRDIINVIGRRFPLAKIYLYPALVQGEGAEASLIKGVDYFDRSRLCDLVIIGRGGGSIEDLWAFNSEALARRIYAADVPIISAVGHETDFTICDFVADMRAPTPSAAAELAVPDKCELLLRLDGNLERSRAALRARLLSERKRLELITDSPIFRDPITIINGKRDLLEELSAKACELIGRKTDGKRERLSALVGKLDALSPLAVLARGYSVAEKDGRVVRLSSELHSGEKIKLRFSDGCVNASVE